MYSRYEQPDQEGIETGLGGGITALDVLGRRYEQPDQEGIETGALIRSRAGTVATSSPIKRA